MALSVISIENLKTLRHETLVLLIVSDRNGRNNDTIFLNNSNFLKEPAFKYI